MACGNLDRDRGSQRRPHHDEIVHARRVRGGYHLLGDCADGQGRLRQRTVTGAGQVQHDHGMPGRELVGQPAPGGDRGLARAVHKDQAGTRTRTS
jgi:hypothetical protein